MNKSLFIFLLTILSALGMKAQLTADWKLHMPFDAWPTQVIETPNRVYFTSRTFESNPSVSGRDVSSNSLFYYDKKGDEILSVNHRVQSSGNAVACMNYNVNKNYLLVVYTDCNIDFIYDDGRIFNLPALQIASIQGKKEPVSISFDHSNNRAYIATSFGYIALNDQRHEVAESRNYGEPVQSIARIGDNIVMCIDGKVLFAPVTNQRFTLDDYKVVEDTPELTSVASSYSNSCFAYKNSYDSYLGLLRWNEDKGTFVWEQYWEDPQFFGIQEVYGGHRLTGNVRIYFLSNHDGGSFKPRPESEYGKPAAKFTDDELWTLTARKGLRSFKVNDTWDWTLTRDYMRPNAPATYISTSLVNHPSYGLLAGSNGYDLALGDFNQQTPNNISALKGGFWKEYGSNYASSMPFASTNNYEGLAIDPQNKNHIYRASTLGGLMRVNLTDLDHPLIFANPSNKNAGKEGFIKVADDLAAWSSLCRFTVPQFSADGTMWTLYNNADTERAEVWYWPAADRLATTSAASYRPMKKFTVPNFPSGNRDVMITLSKNKNMIVMAGTQGGGTVMIYDHNGTPETTSDDRYQLLVSPYDQDGGGVTFLTVNGLYEDPSTGIVWILSERGLFTLNPATIFDEPNRVNRIKVARNDGTNLADYLLNEVNVFSLSVDGEGRKWFGTSNGLVCTSADGRSILGEFTTDNSYLPSNAIFTTCFNPENNSVMVASEGGLVEMFPSGSGGGSSADKAGVRAYPNPVEPDFFGWVRIDNIADGSLVKIADAKGGIVKELGPAQGGSVEWDVSGLNNTRVSTGVYYIMVSPGSSGDGNSQVSKILVLN